MRLQQCLILLKGDITIMERNLATEVTFKNCLHLSRLKWRLYYQMFVRLWLYKNYYRLTVFDLSKQKESDADMKAVQQKHFVG